MPKTPPALIEIASRHQMHLEGYKTRAFNEYAPFLKKISRQLEKRLSGDLTTFNRSRFERLMEQIDGDLKDQYQKYYGVWREQIVDLAAYEAGFEVRSLNQVVDNYDFELPSRSQLRAAVFSKPLSSLKGADKAVLLKDFYRDWTGSTIKKVEGIIRAGYFTGQTTPQIVRQIKGTAAMGFRDGQLARGNRDIEMLTRTALQHAAGEAREETWRANDDIIKAVRIVATLDDRTTAECASLDGEEYPIGEGPRPPFHVGCRTTTAAALDERYKWLSEGATRMSRDESGKSQPGKVSSKETYYEWLKKRPASYQDSVLGPTRGKIFRDGGITPQQFSELNYNKTTFKPYTLKDMREMEPAVFEKAGL